ncbi:F0F1 ATP synthase subunit delta [Candidatus Saccharibacteria bacterium]|nr:F0F1 ATP synthase subunit delta [Candidatus Saccharibacteria bacterium]MBH1972796.1 F0F1 ATP synthase subunit delta [Candidatus Saccharibacteria bacterium]MBH1990997.1 F0F1 ATP synthase subunit delta [Candidatus Saccharibacteria bacterium]OGL23267.1 MAG: hypothetical protein A2791_00205 [Candidatus Saccharibacteria bacterium RIFCSPHIGHO2_01_FULL_46_30]
MAVRVSRRKIASYYADELLARKTDIATRLAALLLDTGRVRELDLIVRDIEDALEARGVVVADIASAHTLSQATQKDITAFLKKQSDAKEVHLRVNVDQALLGGVRINVPGRELDTTLRRKLTLLKASKV